MPGITAIHHSLCDVDAGAGDVRALVHISHVMDWAAVNTHPYRQARLRAQCMTDLERAFNWILDRASEYQRHAVARRKEDELTRGFRCARRFGAAHELIQLLQRFGLFVDEQLHNAAVSAYLSSQGFPVAQGQPLKLTATYDNTLPHTRVMGISLVYVAP